MTRLGRGWGVAIQADWGMRGVVGRWGDVLEGVRDAGAGRQAGVTPGTSARGYLLTSTGRIRKTRGDYAKPYPDVEW